MIDGGISLIILGMVLMYVPAARRPAPGRRPVQVVGLSIMLRSSFALTPPAAPLAAMIAQADARLDADALSRGLRGVAGLYDQA